MAPDRFSLPFLGGVLIEEAERRRPGLGPWSDGVRDELRKAFAAEIVKARAAFMELHEDAAGWQKLEAPLWDIAFPRYCALAEKQSKLEAKDYGVWRGGDLVARGAFVAGGFALGVFLVKSPTWLVPIPQTWDPLVAVMAIAAPFLLDLQPWWHKRRYARALNEIVSDLARAQRAQGLYQPLGIGSSISEPPLDAPAHDAPARGKEGVQS